MIESYFNSVIDKIKKFIKKDGYGDSKFETIAENVKCRKIERTKLVRNDKGNEIVSSIEVWLPPDIEPLPPESVLVFGEDENIVINSGYVSGLVTDQYLRVNLK